MMATHFNTKAGIYVGIDDIDMALYKQTPNLIKVPILHGLLSAQCLVITTVLN